MFGSLLRSFGQYGGIGLEASKSLKESNQLSRYKAHTGDSEMCFYHPEIVYDVYKERIRELSKFEAADQVDNSLVGENGTLEKEGVKIISAVVTGVSKENGLRTVDVMPWKLLR